MAPHEGQTTLGWQVIVKRTKLAKLESQSGMIARRSYRVWWAFHQGNLGRGTWWNALFRLL